MSADPPYWRGLVAAGFIAGQGLLLYVFNETQKTTRQIEMIKLGKELSGEFYVKDGVYREVRGAIESCAPLYTSWGGKFDHDDINRYLGFFEDIGYYYTSGSLNLDIVGHLYGAYIIEAYEYPELKKYIALSRSKAGQPNAFVNFEKLAKDLEAEPDFAVLVQTARTACKAPAASEGKPQ